MTTKTKVKNELDANDLADLIIENKLKSKQKAYDVLRQKCKGAISVMAAQHDFDTKVELTVEDLSVLSKVTEELRLLGYRFRFNEKVVVDEEDNELEASHSLTISLKHLL